MSNIQQQLDVHIKLMAAYDCHTELFRRSMAARNQRDRTRLRLSMERARRVIDALKAEADALKVVSQCSYDICLPIKTGGAPDKEKVYGIWATVSGGVTGSRQAWVKNNGEVQVFTDKAEAEAAARQYRQCMNNCRAIAYFTYTVREFPASRK